MGQRDEERGEGEERVSEEGLTALHLVAHIAAVIPAITLLVFRDAHAGIAGKLIWASCMKSEKMEGWEK